MHSRRFSAFTLIELLTVIAIIGILAAILIPTVGRVREAGRAAKCTSNLRTLATTLVLAAQEKRGVFPMAVDDSKTATDPDRDWMNHLSANYSLGWRPGAGTVGRRNHEIYNCPTTGRDGTGTTFQATNPCYGVNTTILGTSFSSAPANRSRSRNLNTLRDLSRLVLIADVAGPGGLTDGEFRLQATRFATDGFPSGMTTIAGGSPAPRHPAAGSGYSGASFNAAFVDGHVERISTSDARLATVETRRALFVSQ
jgi:prepilin-type N-terminal cleavage/methylation domain-containing protein/prepilin-type processing-associated H-X9-DG protein